MRRLLAGIAGRDSRGAWVREGIPAAVCQSRLLFEPEPQSKAVKLVPTVRNSAHAAHEKHRAHKPNSKHTKNPLARHRDRQCSRGVRFRQPSSTEDFPDNHARLRRQAVFRYCTSAPPLRLPCFRVASGLAGCSSRRPHARPGLRPPFLILASPDRHTPASCLLPNYPPNVSAASGVRSFELGEKHEQTVGYA